MFRCSVLGPYIYVWVCVRAHVYTNWGFPGGSVVKNPPAMQETASGDVDLIPGLGRSSGEGNGKPFQYSCLENPMDRGAWWATQSMGWQKSHM